MSDATLRARQKQAEKSGDLEDQARVLLERVRAGTLSRERLELAAYCGHEAARRATDQGPMRWPVLDQWTAGLFRWPVNDGYLPAALAAAERAHRKETRAWSGPGGQSDAAVRMREVARRRLARSGKAIEAGWAWLANKSLGLTAWCEAHMLIGSVPPAWLPSPEDGAGWFATRINAAQEVVGDRPLRRAFSTRMAAWALSPSPSGGTP